MRWQYEQIGLPHLFKGFPGVSRKGDSSFEAQFISYGRQFRAEASLSPNDHRPCRVLMGDFRKCFQ